MITLIVGVVAVIVGYFGGHGVGYNVGFMDGKSVLTGKPVKVSAKTPVKKVALARKTVKKARKSR